MLIFVGACVCVHGHVCICVCVCVCVCACMCACQCALRIVSMDKILHFIILQLLLQTREVQIKD